MYGPLIAICPEVRTIVPVMAKLIVSAPAAALACAIASRKLPAPLSLVFVTLNMAALAEATANKRPMIAKKRRMESSLR